MHRLAALCPLVLPLLIASCATSSTPDGKRRPNVIVIMTDDQGMGDLGCLGNPVLDTPNIDRLAEQSARLANFYVSPVCTPTRASLMTGRYAYRTRAIDTYIGRAMMEPAEVTMAEVLHDAGYRTGIFGKWHLGDCYPLRACDQGFDETLVLRGGGLAQPSEPRENNGRYTDAILFRSGEPKQTKGYCTDVFFDAAIEFVRNSRSQPFFLYVPTNAPHTPLDDVPRELYEKYRQRDLSAVLPEGGAQHDATARVFAMIENIDHNVGRLLGAIDELGLADDTIVVYLHDNGPQQARANAGLRGRKGDVYEGGVRSPLFVRWPGRLRPGVIDTEVGMHIDVLPTVLDFAGLDVPKDVKLDGRSLRPVLEGAPLSWPERLLVTQAHRGDRPVRGHNVAVRGAQYKLVHATGFGREQPADDVPWQLFDLDADPGEQTDVAARFPEVVTTMRAAYDKWFAEVSSTRPDNFDPPRIVLGTDNETVTTLTRQDWRPVHGNGWGDRGRWLLHFAREHVYEVKAVLRQPIGAARARLTIGGVRREMAIQAGTDVVVFPSLEVPEGDATLEVLIDAKDGLSAPYQVIVKRY